MPHPAENSYDAAYSTSGIRGVLILLQEEGAFADATHTFMATRRSFSKAGYEEVAAFFRIHDNNKMNPFDGWPDLEVPEVLLPCSVLEQICERDIDSQAGIVASMAGPYQVVLSLFAGILRDRPEQRLAGTLVEGNIFCREKLLLFVRVKLETGIWFTRALAQVLCELHAAWHLNRRLNAFVGLPMVFASLSDADNSYFIGYNGKKFYQRAVANPVDGSILDHASNALLTNSMFGVLLDGYLAAIKLYARRSVARGSQGDNMPPGSNRTVSMTECESNTMQGWKKALQFGIMSSDYFQYAYKHGCDDAAEKGLDFLYQSLNAWPDKTEDLLLPSTKRSILAEMMEGHRRMLKKNPNPDWAPEAPNLDDIVSVDYVDWKAKVQQEAVERFWEILRLPAESRTLLEKVTEGDDPFKRLAYLAENLHCGGVLGSALEESAISLLPSDPFLVRFFLRVLRMTWDNGHWTKLV
ncbi:hypothetical protein GGX14DRAFT_554474 [Mycena pura]|uniref:Uncharacterized protein n=1 Tax=Mycena pura TaxID=153505 RepID=A0AAD7E4D7_9AGAR|nr:hypothetical protein GGX14DRAFT_554474 [Mycena pura]